MLSYAQWSTDPYNNLIVGYGLLPEIASDSAGGCYITYEQNLSYPRQLILERLNRYGYKPWGSGKRILGEFPEQSGAKITEDGEGGVIVSYLDVDSDNWPYIEIRLRVQRVDSSGNFLWEATGVRVTLSETDQHSQAIVYDGQGGCIVAWKDTMDVIRVQRVDALGARAWGDSGNLASGATQYTPRLVKTSTSSFVVAFGTLLKKYNVSGDAGWGGQPLNVGFGTRSIIPDNQGGAIVYDAVGTSGNIVYVTQKFDSLGDMSWPNPYVVIADSSIFSIFGYPIVKTTEDMIIFVWEKAINTIARVFAQKLSPEGIIHWPDGGVMISQVSSTDNLNVNAVAGDNGSIVITWKDLRGGLYAQKLSSLGEQVWDSTDIAVSIPTLSYEKVITDGHGGFIVAGSGDFFSIRSQQVSKNGRLGEVITSVSFVQNQLPNSFMLYQNYPNPFNPVTRIVYSLPRDAFVQLKVYNILGQEVALLVSEFKKSGEYDVYFDAKNLPSGVYFYRLQAGKFSDARKMLLMR